VDNFCFCQPISGQDNYSKIDNPKLSIVNPKSEGWFYMRNFSIKIQIFFLIFTLLLNLKVCGWAQESPGLLFQAGLYAEEIQGDLEKALSLYEKIVDEHPDNRSLSAKALLHIGLCNEKLGSDNVRESYLKIITEYPDQRDIAAIAKDKLAQMKKPEAVNPLLKYYFERLSLDPMTSVSFDGKFFAFTDWTSGNFVIKNLKSGALKNLTDINWAETNNFAYHPAWSRDGKYIAFSVYRKINFVELHVVSIVDGKNWIVYSNP
jgi:tetratricopeptide (TPR) repeat protein